MRIPAACLSTVCIFPLLAVLLLPALAAQPQQPSAGDNRRQAVPQPERPTPLYLSTYDLTQTPAGYEPGDLEFVERYCFDEVNRQRRAQQLEPLLLSRELLPLARQYSRRLAEENFFSHTDPEGRTTENRAREVGVKFLLLGENLSQARGYLDPVPEVVRHWMNNPGHRGNILNPEYQYAAVGVWIKDKTYYFTEIFLTKLPKAG
jgi:uncharacterized protein YkwD